MSVSSSRVNEDVCAFEGLSVFVGDFWWNRKNLHM